MSKFPNSIRDAGRCSETGKMAFLSKKDAKLALRRMSCNGADVSNRLRIYKCQFCDYHHIGTITVKGEVVPRHYLQTIANIKVEKQSYLVSD